MPSMTTSFKGENVAALEVAGLQTQYEIKATDAHCKAITQNLVSGPTRRRALQGHRG